MIQRVPKDAGSEQRASTHYMLPCAISLCGVIKFYDAPIIVEIFTHKYFGPYHFKVVGAVPNKFVWWMGCIEKY